MRLTLIPTDKFISVDDQGLLDIQQDLSWIPSDVHAVQWYDDHGEVEFKDSRPNLKITELGIYEQAITDFNNELQILEDERIAQELLQESQRDYWQELRGIRDYKLLQTDWTQLPDAPLTEQQKSLWVIYRQELRDLPDNIDEPKPLVIDPNHPDWTIPPS
jgi:hypothetical protein